MSTAGRRFIRFAARATCAVMLTAHALADDTELFLGDPVRERRAQPNLLLILDNSASMRASVLTRAPYDPGSAYTGACVSGRVYWKSSSDAIDPPDCSSTDRWLDLDALECEAAVRTLAATGLFQDHVAAFDAQDTRWGRLSPGRHGAPVECRSDSPAVNAPGHGDGSSATRLYAQDGDADQLWTSVAGDEIDWGGQSSYLLYSANYINWWRNGPQSTSTRLQIMQNVAKDLLDSINGVNVGLMRFNFEDGGAVAHGMADLATARAQIKAAIDDLEPETWTPLSETLYESALYWMGREIDNGGGSAEEAMSGGSYVSPLESSCQRNFAILLTDGAPTRDGDRDTAIKALRDEDSGSFDALVGSTCDIETYDDAAAADGGDCLDDLAEFLYEADLSELPGRQNVRTYTIGFDVALPVLEDTARRGGGAYRTANDAATLSSVLTDVVLEIVETATTFSAPAVPVDSFNRTRHLSDLFVGVFSPSTNAHWPGNLKKYRLRASDGAIVDADGNAAVDPATGFFAQDARSDWSPTADGPDVEAGGAANRIPAPASRNVYTHLRGNPSDLTHSSNRIEAANPAITDAVLGIGTVGDPTRTELIDFIRGLAPGGQAARHQIGDPMHAQPVVIVYDGTDPDAAVVYFSTNDGYLHAVNASDGVEEWAFVPEEFLGKQLSLYADRPATDKRYGIDGGLGVQLLANSDGVIDAASEKVYLTFGMRRGGNVYYSLDVSDPQAPRLLWQRGRAELAGIGQSWARAVPARIDVNDPAQSSPNDLVLVVAGGYDTSQDSYDNIADANGNSIYILDSEDGDLLWHGSGRGGDKIFANMHSSIPADIKVIDLDTDGYADRMYAADMGGQVWRFDILNGREPAELVRGGVIAQLGAAPLPTSPIAPVADGPDNRRFFYSPDIALVNDRHYDFIHIGIGSGYRAHPLSTVNQDRFYALRDYDSFNALDDAQYRGLRPVTDADLVDVTDDTSAAVPQGAPGWKLELRLGAGWVGEKVLAESRTFNNRVMFTTFVPNAGAPADPCSPAPALNRLYVVDIINGAPVVNLDADASDAEDEDEDKDRYVEFPGLVSSEPVFVFPPPDEPDDCVGDACVPAPLVCVGLSCFPTGFTNDPVRTFWTQEGID